MASNKRLFATGLLMVLSLPTKLSLRITVNKQSNVHRSTGYPTESVRFRAVHAANSEQTPDRLAISLIIEADFEAIPTLEMIKPIRLVGCLEFAWLRGRGARLRIPGTKSSKR